MGGSPVEPILVQGMTCAWCVGEGGAPYKSRPKAVPPAKGGLSRARGPRGVVHRGATTGGGLITALNYLIIQPGSVVLGN